jgi:hypothetical protein
MKLLLLGLIGLNGGATVATVWAHGGTLRGGTLPTTPAPEQP